MTVFESMEFDALMAKIAEAERVAKLAAKELEARKEEVKKFMDEHGADEMVTDRFKAIYRDVVSNKFDTTAFKKDHPRMYKEYVKESVAKPFKHYVLD